jgi:hypothetical protein
MDQTGGSRRPVPARIGSRGAVSAISSASWAPASPTRSKAPRRPRPNLDRRRRGSIPQPPPPNTLTNGTQAGHTHRGVGTLRLVRCPGRMASGSRGGCLAQLPARRKGGRAHIGHQRIDNGRLGPHFPSPSSQGKPAPLKSSEGQGGGFGTRSWPGMARRSRCRMARWRVVRRGREARGQRIPTGTGSRIR